MNKKKLIVILEKFPILYQIILYIKDWIRYKRNSKYVNRFHKMTEKELEHLDAIMYERRQHKKLDWNNLNTYTEKMQWAKIYDSDIRKSLCADKYRVREWVKERIGEEYLIPLIGVWDNFKDINFSSLPNKFVIKTNHGSGDAVIVHNRKDMGLAKKIEIRRKIKISMKTDYSSKHCEMHYSNIVPKIIVEDFIDSGGGGLIDYKFLCFNGKAYFCWVDMDRFSNHTRNVYDLNWNLQKWNQCSYGNYKGEIPKPKNFEKMIDIVNILAKDFSHVRVDLYNVQGKIYFGEMTFTNGSGFEEIVPYEADLMLGKMWNINS